MIETAQHFEAAAVVETFLRRGFELSDLLNRERTFSTFTDSEFRDLREIETPKDMIDLINLTSTLGFTPRSIELYHELIQFLSKKPADLTAEEVICALANALKFELTTDSRRKVGPRQ